VSNAAGYTRRRTCQTSKERPVEGQDLLAKHLDGREAHQVKSDDFITVGVDADMKLAPLAAIVDFEVEHSARLRGPA
jgi:hypothetical protein